MSQLPSSPCQAECLCVRSGLLEHLSSNVKLFSTPHCHHSPLLPSASLCSSLLPSAPRQVECLCVRSGLVESGCSNPDLRLFSSSSHASSSPRASSPASSSLQQSRMIQPGHAGPTYSPPVPPSVPTSHPPSSNGTRSTPSPLQHHLPASTSFARPAQHPLATTFTANPPTPSANPPTPTAIPPASSASVAESGPHQQHSQNRQQQKEGQHGQQQQRRQQQGRQEQGRGQRQRSQKPHSPHVEQWVMEGGQLAEGAKLAGGAAATAAAAGSIVMTPDTSPATSAVGKPGGAVIAAAGSARALSLRGTAELARCDSLSDDDGAFDSPRSDSFLSLCSDNDWSTPGSAFATPMLAASTPIFSSSTPVIAGSTPTYRGRPPSVAAIAARLARLSPSTHADATAGAADVTTVVDGSAVVTVAAAVATNGGHIAGGSDIGGPATCSTGTGVKSSNSCSSSRIEVDARNGVAWQVEAACEPPEQSPDLAPERAVCVTACEHHPLEIGSSIQASSLSTAAAEAATASAAPSPPSPAAAKTTAAAAAAAAAGEVATDRCTEGSEPFTSDASDFEPSLLAVLAESRGLGHASAFADVVGFFEDGGCDEEEGGEDGEGVGRTGEMGYDGRGGAVWSDSGRIGQREGEGGVEREGVWTGGEGRNEACEAAAEVAGSEANGSRVKLPSVMRQQSQGSGPSQGRFLADALPAAEAAAAAAESLLVGDAATEPAEAKSGLTTACLSPVLPLMTALTTASATTIRTVPTATAVHSGSQSATGAASPTVEYPVGCSSLPSSPPHTVTPPMLTWSELSPSPGMSGGAFSAEPSTGLGFLGERSGEAAVDGREIGGEAEGRGEGRGGEGGKDGSERCHFKQELERRCRENDKLADVDQLGMDACRTGEAWRHGEAGTGWGAGRQEGRNGSHRGELTMEEAGARGVSGRNGTRGQRSGAQEDIWSGFRWGWAASSSASRGESSSHELRALLRLQLRFERAMTQLMNCQSELQAKDKRIISLEAQVSALENQFTPGGQRVTHYSCTRTGRHLATFTRQPGSSLYTLTAVPPPISESGQVAASGQVFAAASWSGPEHGLTCPCHWSSPVSPSPPPPGPAPTCIPCVEGRQRATPNSSEFPLTEAPLQTLHMDGEVTEVLIDWIRAACRQLSESFGLDLPVLRLHSDRGGEFSSNLLRAFCRAEGIRQTFTLPASPQQNGIAERRIGMVMDVARTSMIHAAAPHFLWSFAVQYAAHQIKLQPRVSVPETIPTLRWMGKVGDASTFRVWGSQAFVRDLSADKLSSRAVPCVFLGFPPDAPGWHFYHPTSRRVLSSQDVTFDESVPYYRLFPYRTAPLPPPPLFLAPVEPVEVAVDSGAARGAEPAGAGSGGAEPERAEPGGAEFGGAESGGAEPGVAESEGAEPEGAEPARVDRAAGAGGATGAGGPAAAEAAGGSGATGPGGARTGGTGAVGPGGAAGAGAAGGAGGGGTTGLGATRGAGPGAAGAAGASSGPAGAGAPGDAGVGGAGAGGAAGAGAPGGAGVGATGAAGGAGGAGGATGVGADAGGAGAVPAGSGGAARPRPYFVPLLEHVLGLPLSPGPDPSLECPPPVPSESHLVLRCLFVLFALVPLPSPPESSLPALVDPESDSLRAASPTVTRLLATVVTDPSFEYTAVSALVAELVDFAPHCRLDYAASLAEFESASVCPPSVGGECALSTDVLEDRQEEFQFFAAALPHLVSVLLAPEGDPDAPDIPTPRSYAEAIEGTYVDEVPPPGANIVDGMWIFRVKRPPGSPPVFKARYVARGFSQRQGVEYFHTFSPTPKMTTLRVLLHVAAHRDYELHSLDFSTAFLQGSLHEEIWLRRPPGFTGSFPPGTQWSLRRPVYGLRQAPREWHVTLRTTLVVLGFAPSTAGPLVFLRTDTTLPPFYILVYVDDLVFATADTSGLAHVNSELQKRHTCTDLGPSVLQLHVLLVQATPLSTRHSLSALPSDESVEPSGPYPELVGCLMYLMTCTRPDLAYPLSILARYVAPRRHRPEHMNAAKRVLRYLCSTSGMGLVLGGRARVVLTGHADASWVDDLATHRSSQGYTFSLGSGSVSWQSTRSSSILSSSCEAEVYAGAMAAQELRWLIYLLTDFGEAPRSPPVLYVDNKAMVALCQEHILEHRTKHITLRYFLARELQQRGQLRLAYVATRANTADIFTKALQPCDHQRFCTMLGLPAAACLAARSPAARALPCWQLHRCPHRPARAALLLRALLCAALLADALLPARRPAARALPSSQPHRPVCNRHLATFTRRPGSSLYTLTTEPPQVAAFTQMSLPPLPPLPAPPCLPCVEGLEHAAPHSSFPPTTAPLQTLHMEVWAPACVSGQDREHYFLLVVDDYTRYTTAFPLRSKGEVRDVLIPWIRPVRLQLRERFREDLPLLPLHSDRGGEFSSDHCGIFVVGRAFSNRSRFRPPRTKMGLLSAALA
ncbi:unnamed protein product [Closterium sp. NIES-54]